MTGRFPDHRRSTIDDRFRAFTLFELLIAVAVIGLILASVVPFILANREAAQRVQCADNLRVLRNAMGFYVQANHGYPRVRYDEKNNPNGWCAFTGPDAANPFADDSAVKPNDVTASLWLLVRQGYASDTNYFVCPSSSDWADRLSDARGTIMPANRRGNFRSAHNLSYSVFCPFSSAPGFVWADTLKPECALLADKNPGLAPGSDVTKPAAGSKPEAFSVANTRNHGGAGQNVLYADGSVNFERDPYCGVGYQRGIKDLQTGVGSVSKPGDNVYTALRATPIPPGQNPPADGNGVVGRAIGPAWLYDSYLVPTAGDE